MQKHLLLAALLGAASLAGPASAQNTPGTVSGPTGSGVTVSSPAGSSMSQSSKSITSSSVIRRKAADPAPVRRKGSISRKTTGGTVRTTTKTTTVKR
jgi:hypothetical protein